MTEQRLAGRRILVTGGSSGIGRATAAAITAAGGRVAVLARRAGPLERVASKLGGVAVTADVVDAEATRAAVTAAAQQLGGLDGLVNAAGVVRPGSIADADPADWQLTFDVNVRGLLHASQAAIPALRAVERSDIVNISSMSGRRLGSVSMATYAASKAAVHTISEGLRHELAEDGVRVSCIAPGIVATPFLDEVDDPTAASLRERAAEAGLPPEQVADRIVDVLASPPGLVHVEVAMISIDQ